MISHGFEPSSEGLRTSLALKSLAENTRFSESAFGKTRIIHSHPLIRSSKTDEHYCFDGSVVSDTVYANYFERPTELDIARIIDSPDKVAGVYALVSISSGGNVVTRLDGLSQYFLFHYSNGDGKHVIANNPYLIETYLEANGLQTKRSLDGFIASMVWGSAAWGGGGYENIFTIGHNEVLSIRDGKFERTQTPEARPLDYDEAIARTASTLQQSIRTLASCRQGIDAFYDITGGMDSRMIFAALKSTGLHKEFSCSTLFRYPHSDGHYASYLAEKYDLKAHQFKSYGFEESGPYSMRHMDESSIPHYEVFTSFGLNTAMSLNGRFQEPEVMRIHGGHGELAGSSPDVKRSCGPISNGGQEAEDSSPKALAENYIKSIWHLRFANFLAPKVQEELGERTREIFDRVGNDAFVGNETSQLFYNQGRNRTHFTLISYMRNRLMQYPDVLCMRSLQDAGRWLSVNEKAAGKANFDIIHTLGGDEITSIPMADKPWSDLADPRGLGGRDYIAGPDPKRFSKPFNVSHPQHRAEFEVDSRLSGMTRRDRLIVYQQQVVSNALSRGNPIADVFDATKLASLIDMEPGQLRKEHLRVLQTAAKGAIWMERDERASRIAPSPASVIV